MYSPKQLNGKNHGLTKLDLIKTTQYLISLLPLLHVLKLEVHH